MGTVKVPVIDDHRQDQLRQRRQLEHALAQLQGESRLCERRLGERRIRALMLLALWEERRSYANRRRGERRAIRAFWPQVSRLADEYRPTMDTRAVPAIDDRRRDHRRQEERRAEQRREGDRRQVVPDSLKPFLGFVVPVERREMERRDGERREDERRLLERRAV